MARVAWRWREGRRELEPLPRRPARLPGMGSSRLRQRVPEPCSAVARSACDSSGGGGQHPEAPPPPPGTPAAGEPVDERSAVQPGRRYGLPELVELATASSPEHRILWQRARAAALAVGVAHSSYWPTLSAVAFAGYQHSSFPVSSLPAGITLAAPEFLPGISVSGGQGNERVDASGWTRSSSFPSSLCDGRRSTSREARQ